MSPSVVQISVCSDWLVAMLYQLFNIVNIIPDPAFCTTRSSQQTLHKASLIVHTELYWARRGDGEEKESGPALTKPRLGGEVWCIFTRQLGSNTVLNRVLASDLGRKLI